MSSTTGMQATLAWLERLVRQPTIAGQSNTQLIGEVAEYLADLGAQVTVTTGARAEALNLHASLGPVDGAGIMLCAHSDVVDVAGQPWRRDPFALHVDAGRAYGRGAADMKGFLAAVLAALGEANARRLKRPLLIALSSDEEVGCLGVRPLLDRLEQHTARPAWVLVGEPTSLAIADRHKGKAAVRVGFSGLAAHSSQPQNGANAVAYAGRLITQVLELQRELADGAHDTSFAVPYTTLGIGPIAGGVAVNMVPDQCRLDLEVRAVPGEEPAAWVGRLRQLCAELATQLQGEYAGASVSVVQLSCYPGLAPGQPSRADPEITSVCGTERRVAVDFGTEAGLYQQRLGVPVVVCGPGCMDDAHHADESIELAQLDACHTMISRALTALYA